MVEHQLFHICFFCDVSGINRINMVIQGIEKQLCNSRSSCFPRIIRYTFYQLHAKSLADEDVCISGVLRQIINLFGIPGNHHHIAFVFKPVPV